MKGLWRIVKFKSRSQTADRLPCMKGKDGKIPLFTTYEKAHHYIYQVYGSQTGAWHGIYPDEFVKEVTGRYVIDPICKECGI